MTSDYTSVLLPRTTWLLHPLILFGIVLLLLYKYSIRNFNYWKNRGIPFPDPLPPFGNFAEVMTFRTSPSEWLKKQYDSCIHPVFGIYIMDDPYLVVKDPALSHRILVKDFSYFPDRNIAAPAHDELTSNLLFFQKGAKWRERRSKLSRLFATDKIRAMYPRFNKCAQDLVEYLIDHDGDPIETKDLIGKYSTDIMGKCFFGFDVGSFRGDPEFRKYGREIFEYNFRNAVVQSIYVFKPTWVQTFKIDFFRKLGKTYFLKVFTDTMTARKENRERKGDIIDLLNDMLENRELYGDEGFGSEKILSPALQMYMAGFETTSSTAAFTLFELCVNVDLQEKVREEIKIKIEEHHGVTHEAVQDMTHLDMCVKESLRKYPPVGFLDRVCNKDYKLPGLDLVVEKGIRVIIPVYALNYDEKYFPEPEKFIPERFEKEEDRTKNVFLPFGKGPRFCIGDRLGKSITKLALIHILTNFKVELSERTSCPLELDPKSWLLHPKGGLHLKYKKLTR